MDLYKTKLGGSCAKNCGGFVFGQTVDSGRMICVDYTGALMWDAMGFARPGGVPGEAASWALAPTKE
jgi:hypothetical protein